MNEMITWPGGEWKTVRLIGRGGYGAVYEIQREEFGKVYKAAMKVMRIPAESSDARKMMYEGMSRDEVSQYYTDYVKRLSEEFALLSTLKGYTNIVSYEDHKILRDKDGIGWTILIRMELLTPVNEYFSQHRLSEEEVIRLGSDICRALEICHERNIIHRDIKLDNIFVNERGDFELGDFGIARITEETMSTMTSTGTPGYMAPEVYLKQKYGQNVDIYSLGIAMYMLLNRKRGPFYPVDRRLTPGDREKALNARMSGMKIPEPLYGSRRLKEAVLKAIACRPEERFQTAEEFRKAFTEEEKTGPLEEPYRQALQMAQKARTWMDFENAGAVFRVFGDYKDSRACARKCSWEAERLKAEENRQKEAERIREAEANDPREAFYRQAVGMVERAATSDDYLRAEAVFGILNPYKDSPKRAAYCRQEANRLKNEEGKTGPFEEVYRQALQLAQKARTGKDYEKAEAVFRMLGNHKDSRACADRCRIEAERLNAEENRLKEAETNRLREAFYQQAIGMEDHAVTLNDYLRAEEAFRLLGSFKDSQERAAGCRREAGRSTHEDPSKPSETYRQAGSPVSNVNLLWNISGAKVGDVVAFGRYEQTLDASKEIEDIEWIILDKKDNKALLISKFVLDAIPYNEERENVTWGTCTLRRWLNREFMDAAFAEVEELILMTHLANEDNSKYGTFGGYDTDDKIFCLSIAEAEKYLKVHEIENGYPTEYAKGRGIYLNDTTKASWWWLRSPGSRNRYAASINHNGSMSPLGNDVSDDEIGVRPALWVKLEA